jgi:hypothetical protein
MKELYTTAHGRLLSAAIAVALIGGGAAALTQAQVLMSVSVFIGIVLGIVAVGLSVEDHKTPLFTSLAVIILPVLLFLYAFAVSLAMAQAPWAGYPFVGLGIAFAGAAILGGERKSIQFDQPAHAT